MPEEMKEQAGKIVAEMSKLTPQQREMALIFMQGMLAVAAGTKEA